MEVRQALYAENDDEVETDADFVTAAGVEADTEVVTAAEVETDTAVVGVTRVKLPAVEMHEAPLGYE